MGRIIAIANQKGGVGKVNTLIMAESIPVEDIETSNAKRNLLGNYHKIKRKYLQLYLNEFVYKLNWRYFGERIFDRLIVANVTGLWVITDMQIKVLKNHWLFKIYF